ncbi:thioredoxin family protein [Flocculibacter collagenilyticus]|uniref:thioredoxin family protein n=1 Tax=Flocculibacter collagenilyticus TaxID=2744479 RepID=UPI0018F489BC|nr:thioredoxin family protein [Flocculibacter collagenilyticus]
MIYPFEALTKIQISLLALVLLFASANVQAHELTSSKKAGTTSSMLIGEVSSEKLLSDYPKFQHHYDSYEVSESDIAWLKKIEKKISIIVLFGAWCHDSQREVPRFIKILEQHPNPLIDVQYVAVNYKKQDEQGVAKKHKLKYTPTFVVLEDDVEIGRIVEQPESSLAQDLFVITNNDAQEKLLSAM